MNDRPEIEELASLIRSQAPVLLVASHEEPRVRALFERACARLEMPLFTWSITDGIRRAGREDVVYETNELRAALRHIDKTPQNGVYLLCDADPGFDDPVNCRLIREIALEHHRVARTLVFLSPTLADVPAPIARLALRFSPLRPSRDEIRQILSEEAQLWATQNGERPKADPGAIEAMVLHLSGLEQDDVRRLIRQALRADGEINQDDVRRLLHTKHDLLGGDGMLGYEPRTATFDEVGGLANLKRWIRLRQRPFLDATAGADRPRGVLLLGVQGGGKSLAARAIAGEWHLPLMRLDFGALYDKFQGETERKLRAAFAAADGMAPCVLWIDEIEKGVSTDGGASDGGVSRRVLGSFLTWLSERDRPVYVVATANDISELPPELVRKGRFDEIFFVDFPNAESRAQILAIHLARRGHECSRFDLNALAAACDGYSGAEIEQAIVSAGFETRANDRSVEQADVLAEIARTRPLSVVMAERIGALRAWAATRAVMADDPVQ